MFFSMGCSHNILAGGFRPMPMWGGHHHHHCCAPQSPMYNPAMGMAFLTMLMGRNTQSSMSFGYNIPIFSMPYAYSPTFMPPVFPSYSGFTSLSNTSNNDSSGFSLNFGMFNPFMSFNTSLKISGKSEKESDIAKLNRLQKTKSTTVKASGEKKSADNFALSDGGVALIKEFEGCKLTAYKCSANQWTIGYGHTQGVKEGQTITQAQADEFLKSDIKSFENTVKSAVKVPLTQNQFDALVSFTYNVGQGNLQKSTLLKKLNNGDYEGAAAEFEKWNKSGGKELTGLTRRREAERKLFCS